MEMHLMAFLNRISVLQRVAFNSKYKIVNCHVRHYVQSHSQLTLMNCVTLG